MSRFQQLLFCFGLLTSVANAQQQTTTGPNSPIVNSQGNVTLNYSEVNKLIRTLEELANADSARVERLMAKGRFSEAADVLKQSNRRLRAISADIAFQSYAEGVLLLAQGKTVSSFDAFTAAMALQRDNCQYRALAAMTSMYLDRLSEARRIAGEHSEEARRCLNEPSFIDGARLLLVQSRLAIEARDELATRRLMNSFELAIDTPFRSEAENFDALLLNCEMSGLQEEIWLYAPEVLNTFKSESRCRELGESVRNKDAQVGRLVSFGAIQSIPDDDHQYARAIQELTDQLEVVQKSPEIGRLGFDEVSRATNIGRLLLDRGFYRLWGPDDIEGARADYRNALEHLQPVAALTQPEALIAYAQLVIKIRHLDSIAQKPHVHPALTEMVEAVISRVLADRRYEVTPRACLAILEMATMASDPRSELDTVKQVQLEDRVRHCVDTGMSPSSLRANSVIARLDASTANRLAQAKALPEAEKALSAAIELLEDARGFPLFAERSNWLGGWRTQRAAIRALLGRKDDARVDFEAVVNLTRRDPHSAEHAQALGYLASHIATYYEDEELAGSLAETAFDLQQKSWSSGSHGCAELFLMLKGGELAASIWLDSRSPPRANALLVALADWNTEAIGRCRDIPKNDAEGMPMLVVPIELIVLDAQQALHTLGIELPQDEDGEFTESAMRLAKMLDSAPRDDKAKLAELLPLTKLAIEVKRRGSLDTPK